jgi:hypothetical protein
MRVASLSDLYSGKSTRGMPRGRFEVREIAEPRTRW